MGIEGSTAMAEGRRLCADPLLEEMRWRTCRLAFAMVTWWNCSMSAFDKGEAEDDVPVDFVDFVELFRRK
jgi:hypothetical protein